MTIARTLRCVAAAAVAGLAAAGCGGSDQIVASPAPVVLLTAEDREAWAPRPGDGSAAVLLYHGIGAPEDFSNAADAGYGLDPDDFAKQMKLLHYSGYRTVTLDGFARFLRGETDGLPDRPLLLTFDDGRVDSFTEADGALRRHGFSAVLFIDVGRVDAGDPEYLTWDELDDVRETGRWEVQLHAGARGHTYVRVGDGPDDTGPFYAYREVGESYEGWRARAFGDLDEGAVRLAEQARDVTPVAFAPPFGNYGQDGTNDERIPDALLAYLLERYAMVFTQDRSPLSRPGDRPPFGRFQLLRSTTGGDLRAAIMPTGG